MNIYYTIDERYLKALEKLDYGNTPKAKLILEEILEAEPGYGKAHFHLACIYYDSLREFELAFRHIELALKFAPDFPEAYHKYLSILNELENQEKLLSVSAKALKVKGICKACVYHEVGLLFEKNRSWEKALENYREAYLHSVTQFDLDRNEKYTNRVKEKMKLLKKVVYVIS